jgi:hypothetical protein
VAQQTLRMRERLGAPPTLREFAHLEPRREFWTTGDPVLFSRVASALLGFTIDGRRASVPTHRTFM